uniref:Transcription factor AP-4 n=1 Tax=Amazona collaria TaxID=241587 RepID=A0A8B9GMD4_9PSIT
MEYFMVPAQKVPSLQHFRKSEKEVIGGLCSLANIPLTPETQRDQERRIRREIANSNERRRMQSINAGFQSLKTLIPHTDGEKLSKAAILQQTAEYIFSLEQEKTRLLQQNTQLKRFIQEFSGSSPKRRRAEDKDEGIGSPDIWEDEKAEDLRREMIELRQQLDKERSVRMMLEEQVRPCGARSSWTHPLASFSPAGAPWECWCGWSVAGHVLLPPLRCAWLWAPWLCCGHCVEGDSLWLGIKGCSASSRLGSPPVSGLSWPAGSLPGGPHVPREAEGDRSASAAPAAAGAGEVAAPGEARARAADPNPAPAITCSPSAHPPPHCDRSSAASLPSRHRGHHGPILSH